MRNRNSEGFFLIPSLYLIRRLRSCSPYPLCPYPSLLLILDFSGIIFSSKKVWAMPLILAMCQDQFTVVLDSIEVLLSRLSAGLLGNIASLTPFSRASFIINTLTHPLFPLAEWLRSRVGYTHIMERQAKELCSQQHQKAVSKYLSLQSQYPKSIHFMRFWRVRSECTANLHTQTVRFHKKKIGFL